MDYPKCSGCDNLVVRPKKQLKYDSKMHTKLFCSVSCHRRSLSNSVETTCGICQKQITKVLSEVNGSKSGLVFCSRSCAATYTNKVAKKREVEGNCFSCCARIPARKKYCVPCFSKMRVLDYTILVLGDLRSKPGIYSNRVRQYCRSWNKDLLVCSCQKCGYSKHVELAHIKPISSFLDTDLVLTINAPENILVLCPNCHWELDAGELDIKDIPSRVSVN
jgi:5-methylcytosine-specific restriction endonuclease McrA